MAERSQCAACPWRDLDVVREVGGERTMEAARRGEVFTCHTRMGPCPGPERAGLVER